MFDGLKNLGAMASLMKDLPRMQARMQEVRESLAEIRAYGSDASGTVNVVARGDLRVDDVHIGDGAPQDCAALQQAVKQAANAALESAQAQAQERLAAVAQEMGLPTPSAGQLPGMGM
ncbi:MAG: YbaB/EbfC family nucleoid-associated protein [Phycisphaerales bacterium]|nr:YbaB/EbfC family nucleoid-associated protein [Phycisphaerales bacterium]